MGNRGLVALTGAALGLLTTPAHATQEMPKRVGMVAHLNLFPDYFGNALPALCFVFVLGMISTAFAVEVGEKAPDFELPSTQGGKLKLSSFQGKKNVLIEF